MDHESLMRDLAGLVPFSCKCGTTTHASSKTYVVRSHERPDHTWCLMSFATLAPDALHNGHERALLQAALDALAAGQIDVDAAWAAL